MNVFKVTLSQ